MTKRTIKWKFFLYLLGFSGILLLILWLMQTVFLGDMYKLIRRWELQSAIQYVDRNIAREHLDGLLRSIEWDKDILVKRTEDYVRPDPPQQSREGRRVMPESIEKTQSFTLADGSQIQLTFYALITPLDATISTLRTQLLLVTLITAALSVLIALLVSRKVARPIEELNVSAKELAKGKMDTRFEARGYLEIEELADTLNKTAAELAKVDSLRRELIANISHDLRTPLALIYSYAEMMSDFPAEVNEDSLRVIMNESARLSTLVNDVLDVSQMESGQMELKLSEFSLTEKMEALTERISAMLRQDGYSIRFTWDKNLRLQADTVKIEQVLYNLLINAVNYCGEDKTVLIRQIVRPTEVLVEVEDHGPGISEKDLENIWERYYKLQEPHQRAVVGSGLGLSIVRRIIALHGGQCGVRSQKGEGSTFFFTLPL